MPKKIAIFASGGGSNAEKIIQHFKDNPDVDVALIVSNNPKAYVLERAKNHHISDEIINKNQFLDSDIFLDKLLSKKIDLIVLAGFLWLIPQNLIKAFPKKIINIHPALLPKYGGKGMYGHHIHQAVFNNFEKESGITIHYVNEAYDEGQIIFQKSIALAIDDTPDKIAEKVLTLEHSHFAEVIEGVINS